MENDRRRAMDRIGRYERVHLSNRPIVTNDDTGGAWRLDATMHASRVTQTHTHKKTGSSVAPRSRFERIRTERKPTQPETPLCPRELSVLQQ